MGRPKLGYHIKAVRDIAYMIIEGKARHKFSSRTPTSAEIADALAIVKASQTEQPAAPQPAPAEKDTLRALADAYYKSKQFLLDIGEVTRTSRRNAIEALLRTLTPEGRRPRAQVKVYDLTRKHVLAIQSECLHIPETANARVKVLRYMYDYALDAEWPGVIANPAKDVKLLPPKVKVTPKGEPYTGHRPWQPSDAERFLDFHKDDADACQTIGLMLYTGARISDAFKLGRPMETMIEWRGTPVRCLKFKATKGAEKRAREGKKLVDVIVPIVPELAAVLEQAPADSLVYLLNEHRRSWGSAKSLGNRVRKWCDEIFNEDGSRPFDGLSSHGLRKACANWWVKHYRCTTHELMAMFGWLTEDEALLYTQGYDREDAAAGVVVRFPAAAGRTG